MELSELKAFARQEEIEINWDKLDSDPFYADDFERVVQSAVNHIPQLEQLHTKLAAGESVAFEGQASPLKFMDLESYLYLVETELFAAYQIQDVHERYHLIKSITHLSS